MILSFIYRVSELNVAPEMLHLPFSLCGPFGTLYHIWCTSCLLTRYVHLLKEGSLEGQNNQEQISLHSQRYSPSFRLENKIACSGIRLQLARPASAFCCVCYVVLCYVGSSRFYQPSIFYSREKRERERWRERRERERERERGERERERERGRLPDRRPPTDGFPRAKSSLERERETVLRR